MPKFRLDAVPVRMESSMHIKPMIRIQTIAKLDSVGIAPECVCPDEIGDIKSDRESARRDRSRRSLKIENKDKIKETARIILDPENDKIPDSVLRMRTESINITRLAHSNSPGITPDLCSKVNIDRNVEKVPISSCLLDCLFLVDQSESVKSHQWTIMKSFIIQTISTLSDLGENWNRVPINHRYSIRGFGSENDSEIIFDTSFDNLNVLEQLERVNRDGTHTHSALQTALKNDVPKMLKNSKKIIFVLTDGESKYPDETFKSALELKQIKNMTVGAIGFGDAVGNTNVREELLNIASSEDLAFEMMPSTAIESTVMKMKTFIGQLWKNSL